MEKQVYEFISAQTGEKIVERRKCPGCGQEFAITDKDLEFYSKISPIFNGTRYEIPAPKLCPDCRQQRRLARRNERKLYKRKCDLTDRTIVSIYAPESPYKVYNQPDRWSDKWNAMDYGRDFDFTRPFFQQFTELARDVPKISMYRDLTMENSDYANYWQYSKNLYLCVNCYHLEDSYYSTSCFPLLHETETTNIDCQDCSDSSDIYDCVSIKNSQKCFFCTNIEDCYDCRFCDEIIWCSYCICSTNKNNSKYLFLNNQVSPEEFENIKKRLLEDKNFFDETSGKYNDLKKSSFYRADHNTQSENVSWDYIINCKNVHYSFFSWTTENAKFIYTSGYFAKNMYDGMNCWWYSDLAYELLHIHLCFKSAFLIDVDDCKDSYYCYQCYNSSNLFGCVWLRDKQYCIFNTQYTKEDYETLIPKIIEHMKKYWERWEFFPVTISPFGYNETAANEFKHLDRETALSAWFKRMDKEYPINVPDWIELIRAQDLSDNINDVSDDILKKAIVCEVSWKPFRLIKWELDFYRKHNLPLPKHHPDIRHLERVSQRSSKQIYLRTCSNCGKQIISIYPADSEFKVYCEDCYNKQSY